MTCQAVVLAGGLGTRLRPVAGDLPKPMVVIAGKPFLYWQLCYLKQQGIKQILLLISYQGHYIKEYFGDGSDIGLNIDYSEELEPMGTGGALHWALPKLNSEFLLLNGDSLLYAPLVSMWESFLRGSAEAMIATHHDLAHAAVPANISVCGDRVVEYRKEAGEGCELIDAGIYAVRRRALDEVTTGNFDIGLLWQALIRKGRLTHCPFAEKFYDIGTPERMRIFEEKLHEYF